VRFVLFGQSDSRIGRRTHGRAALWRQSGDAGVWKSDLELMRSKSFVNESGFYSTAAICLRGHVVTADVDEHPRAATKFCSECGAAVITRCPHCEAPIQGHYFPPGVRAVGGVLNAPSFCSACGKPFPWVAEKLSAARELADELEELTPEDRTKLKTSLDDISTNGPRAEAGAARIKKMLGKATSAVGQAVWKISVDIASETAKKIMMGG
jgi:hypothetical protein